MTSSAFIVTFSYLMCNSSLSRLDILQGSIPTGQKFRKILIEQYGFLPENIKMITDETRPTPTKSYVVRKLCKSVSKLKRGDKFVYLFIGHGNREVVQYDDLTGHVEYQICGMDKGYQTVIVDYTLRQIVQSIPDGVYFTMISDSAAQGDCWNPHAKLSVTVMI
ncbi:hypothetical protein OROGR_017388 [Orobanche gracilis]